MTLDQINLLRLWLNAHGKAEFHREGSAVEGPMCKAVGLPPSSAILIWRALRDGKVNGWGAVDRYGYYWLVNA